MATWYENRILLNTFILIMVVAFAIYMYQRSTEIGRWGLVIFLTSGTLIMIRGVVRITMRMRKGSANAKK
ncbi:MAG: hypothetical protein OXT74_09490 [Candidatus Poribacteria bacterium]|nr:hypothetical protein [Candidatus Poribacteria bacterium]MDE0506778.1 hypothetical protein [Candidatus Poribacteria bacterium]